MQPDMVGHTCDLSIWGRNIVSETPVSINQEGEGGKKEGKDGKEGKEGKEER